MKKKHLFILITFLISFTICFIGGEIMARYFFGTPHKEDERNTLYRYDDQLGWFPIPNIHQKFKRGREVTIQQNSLGFRDIEHGEKTKKRIAFLGDSFVWGYDVNQEEMFTEKLRPLLPEWDIINMGVSGYGTDQAYLLLQKWFDYFQPDVVCLVFYSENDFYENATNKVYRYYKPYYTLENHQLQLNGVPVPESIKYYNKKYPNLHKSRLVELMFELWLRQEKFQNEDNITAPLIKAMNQFVTSNGAEFVLAFAEEADQPQHCSFCETENISHLFLTNDFKYDTHGFHWTPEGHDFVAEKLHQFILQL